MAQGTTRGVPIDIDVALAANSDILVPSQKAVKTYADTKVSSVIGTSPIISSGETFPSISIPQADGHTDGYLSASDFTIFSGKGDGDMLLASTQTNSGTKTFLNTTFLLRNVANTFNGSFTNTNTADRVYTLPDTTTALAGLAVPINNFTGRITMGTTTGTSLLCFPDAGTTAADGIQFGSGTSNLYRSAANTIKTDGTLNAASFNTSTGVFTQNILRVSNSGGLFLGYQGGGGGLKLLPNSGTTVYAEVKSTGEFALTPPSLTGSSATSALSITQTLNTSGSPDIISLDFTNTSSGAATNLLNFKLVGGASLFKVTKLGQAEMNYAKIGNLTAPFNTSAILEVRSTTQGFLPPVMTSAQRLAIATPATGLMVYQTDGTEGLYIKKSGGWALITAI